MTKHSGPLDWLGDALTELDAAELRRRLVTHRGAQGAFIDVDGQQLANFASNDYLGLAAHPRVVEAAIEACHREGWGAGASPLITGHAAAHEQLEQRLAKFEGTEAALLFSSGYAANVGAITALVGRGDAVFGDALNHASLIDGCRLSRADVHIYRHADSGELEQLLKRASGYRRKLIVTDTLFSMDGDVAPIDEIAQLAEQHGCMLLVDEAHATGVFGPGGRGLCAARQIDPAGTIHVGTLSKALGSVGGFVCGSRRLIDWLLNRARAYIFSTANPPAASAAALAAIELIESEPQRRQGLLAMAAELRHELTVQGWGVGQSQSQIIPVMAGTAQRALALSAELRQRGFWVPAIRAPSVPANAARLRISLSAAHTRDTVTELARVLAELRTAVG